MVIEKDNALKQALQAFIEGFRLCDTAKQKACGKIVEISKINFSMLMLKQFAETAIHSVPDMISV